jgi:pimeloyl-ACP methyl ester carboxylesterase
MSKLFKQLRLFKGINKTTQIKLFSLIFSVIFSGCTYLGLTSIPVHTLESNFQNDQSRYIEIDGLRVHYRDEGDGPVLLLIHNELGSLHSWDGWVKELGGKYRIVRMDLPGFGLTGPASLQDYGRSATVDFISRFIDELNLTNINLVGASYGGFTAWNYALDYPDNVNKLILLAPVGYTQKLPLIVQVFTAPGSEMISSVAVPKPMVEQALRQGFGSKKRLTKDIINRYHHLLLREGNRTSAARFFKVLKEHSQNEYLGVGIKDISVPTFVMWGEQDRWTPIEYLDLWMEDIADAEFMRYPSVGHYPHEEVPTISAQDADLFIQGRLEKFPGT